MVINVDHQSGSRSVAELPLPPGFRFYPTDEELVSHYLRKKADSETFQIPIIAEVDLYKFDPWDLPSKALFGEKDWYFFSPRDRKYPKGVRPNRAAASGYWKATGTDKPIFMSHGRHSKVGVKKSLVFYRGRAPRGDKTNWIMHEYRLADGVASSAHHHRLGSLRLDDWVLCKIYEKSTHAQRAGHEHDLESMLASLPEIDDPGVQNSLTGADSAAPEDGRLTTSLPMLYNPSGGVSAQEFQTSAALRCTWELQQARASTSSLTLDKSRFLQELASAQVVSSIPLMPGHLREFPHRSSYNPYPDLVAIYNAMPTGHAPISDDEAHRKSFQSPAYVTDSMYPALGYDHPASQSTASYGTPGASQSSVLQSGRSIPDHPNFDFSYGELMNHKFN